MLWHKLKAAVNSSISDYVDLQGFRPSILSGNYTGLNWSSFCATESRKTQLIFFIGFVFAACDQSCCIGVWYLLIQ